MRCNLVASASSFSMRSSHNSSMFLEPISACLAPLNTTSSRSLNSCTSIRIARVTQSPARSSRRSIRTSLSWIPGCCWRTLVAVFSMLGEYSFMAALMRSFSLTFIASTSGFAPEESRMQTKNKNTYPRTRRWNRKTLPVRPCPQRPSGFTHLLTLLSDSSYSSLKMSQASTCRSTLSEKRATFSPCPLTHRLCLAHPEAKSASLLSPRRLGSMGFRYE